MHTGLTAVRDLGRPVYFIGAAGFEERAPRALLALSEMGVQLSGCIILTYDTPGHDANQSLMLEASRRMLSITGRLHQIPTGSLDRVASIIAQVGNIEHFIIDITGLTRKTMIELLAMASKYLCCFWLMYTEAETYYPTCDDFDGMLGTEWRAGNRTTAFFQLAEYEEADLVYSANCRIEEIPSYPGRHLPNYPLMILAFLTFKRSRLSSVLREFEATRRILIEGVPVREDLKWRRRAIEVINFDLIEENRDSVITLNTLEWRATDQFLEELYLKRGNCFRYNFLLAPLGSKMQTVGAWSFARRHREVKLVTSTPTRHFPAKYSTGWRETFILDDIQL